MWALAITGATRSDMGGGCGALPLKKDGGLAAIADAHQLPVAAFFGHAYGREIVRVDQTGGLRVGKVAGGPIERGAQRFGGVAFAVCGGGKHPTGFRHVDEGGDVALPM